MALRWDEQTYLTNGSDVGIYGNELCEKLIVEFFLDQIE